MRKLKNPAVATGMTKNQVKLRGIDSWLAWVDKAVDFKIDTQAAPTWVYWSNNNKLTSKPHPGACIATAVLNMAVDLGFDKKEVEDWLDVKSKFDSLSYDVYAAHHSRVEDLRHQIKEFDKIRSPVFDDKLFDLEDYLDQIEAEIEDENEEVA